MMRRRTLAACAFLLLSACKVGPKYRPPSLPAPPAYKESQGWKTAQPADSTIRSAWWEIFGTPELNALEEQVDVSNPTLRAAEARFREARALVRLNRSNLFPTVSAGPALSTNRVSNALAVDASANKPYGDYLLPLDLTYELDAWGRIRRSLAAAREEAQATAADLETIRLSLHAELAIDYFEMRSLDAQKQLLDQTLVAYQKALDLTENRFEGGLSSKVEVALARTQLETARSQDIGVGVARARFEHAIAILVGRTPETLSLPPAPLNLKPPAIPVGLPSQLIERRPDIAAAERRVAEANEQIGIARAAFFPALLITATGGFQGGSFVNWLSWPNRFWAVGPSALQILFDAGRRRAASDAATAGYDQTLANYVQSTLLAFQQVEDNLSTLRILEKQAAAQRVAVEAAEQSLELSLNQYKGGLVTYLQVVTAQTAAYQNEFIEVDLLRQRMDASVLLIKALGGGWDVSKLPPA
jgi:NodT family efflux transporter outer membrane factor (OMF) lipoprotein